MLKRGLTRDRSLWNRRQSVVMALTTACRFESGFHALGVAVEFSRLPLFRNIEYLAPRKEIRTLVDSSAASATWPPSSDPHRHECTD